MMHAIKAIMLKDFKLLFKDKMAVFFTFIFPLVFAFFFGSIFAGGGGGSNGLKIAVADLDNTETSQSFIKQLDDSDELVVTIFDQQKAQNLVRTGKVTAFMILPKGFGEKYGSVFSGEVPEVLIGIDPARKAEAGYLEGALMKQGVKRFENLFSNANEMIKQLDISVIDINQSDDVPDEWKTLLKDFLPQMKDLISKETTTEAGDQPLNLGGSGENPMMPLKITQQDISVKRQGPKNAYSITIPQGIIWAIMGCVIGFAVNLVQEKRLGTISRLTIAPISRFQIMSGKALGCFVAQFTVTGLLLTIAYVFLGVTFDLGKILLAILAAGTCFVGVMMFFAAIAKTERSVAGLTNAFLIIMGMIGGAMIPLFIMPGWMQTISNISPVKWSILALEGAIWRDFSYVEMLTPVAILMSVGVVFFLIATKLLKLEEI
jgi:ABC-2 type transport system permease protein